MSGWVDINILFVSRSFNTFPNFLTYYFFQGCPAELTSKFFCISHIYHVTGFPYLLTTFSKDVWLSWPKNKIFVSRFFTTLPDFLTYILITYYFFEECQAEWTSNFFFVFHLFTALPDLFQVHNLRVQVQVPVAQVRVRVQVLMTSTRVLVLVTKTQVGRVPEPKYPCFVTQNVKYEF